MALGATDMILGFLGWQLYKAWKGGKKTAPPWPQEGGKPGSKDPTAPIPPGVTLTPEQETAYQKKKLDAEVAAAKKKAGKDKAAQADIAAREKAAKKALRDRELDIAEARARAAGDNAKADAIAMQRAQG
jgi:hypothetical protein